MLTEKDLIKIRQKLGVTQEGMARLLGVSFTSINRWENGHSLPTGTTAAVYEALKAAFNRGYASGKILAGQPLELGRFMHHLFKLAYGG